MAVSRRLLAGAAVLVCAGMLAGTTAAGGRSSVASHYPFLRHSIGEQALSTPLPFRGATSMAAAQRRIHQLTVNATPDAGANDSQLNTQIVDLGAGKLVAVFEDSGEFDGTPGGGNDHYTGYAWSDNNGLSWNDAGHLPDTTNGDWGRPSIATDATTDAVYLAENDLTLTQIMVFKSTDSGHSFAAPTNGSPGVTQAPFNPRIAVDNFAGVNNGNVYLCWTQYSDPNDPTTGKIMFSRSLDDGATFGPSGGRLLTAGGDGCFVAVGPSNWVYVFYYKGDGAGGIGGNNKLFMQRSANAGASFGAPIQVADLNTTSARGDLGVGPFIPSFPTVAVNPATPRPYLYVVYNDDPLPLGGADRGDAFYVKSTNNGTTWSAAVKINDVLAGDQFFPDVAFANGGERLLFTYNSLDPVTGFYHRRGRLGVLDGSGAVTLNQSFQLSPNAPFVFGLDPAEGGYSGEYEGSAGGAGAISTLWSDTRLGNAFHVNQPDVRFARITVPPPNTDLAVTMTRTPASIKLGDISNFTITVKATGGAANDVFLNVSLPIAGLALRAGGTPNKQCDIAANRIGCSLGPIAAGGSRTVQLLVMGVNGPGNRTVVATATTSSKETTPANNIAQAVVAVTAARTTTNSSTGNVAIPIPDNDPNGIAYALTVPTEGNAVQATVAVRLNHTYDADLEMYLISPIGTTVPLVLRRGGPGHDFGTGANNCAGTKTTFNDLATVSIAGANAPFANSFRPESPIAGLLGEPSDGIWYIFFRDLEGPDVGTIGCVNFSLTIVK